MSSTPGSSTSTVWKRRSRAASFSTFSRYSSRVVAPMQCSSPRASEGLSMLPASIEPSARPAPTMVWSSSTNSTTCPCCLARSFSSAFMRSSNSPRNFVPAMREPMSSERTRRPFSPSGTSPSTMRWASPSTIAVLPTPGSPMSTGLFLVRRWSTWTVRRISSSRPMTGSSLPCSARAVRSMVNFSRAWRCSSAPGSSTACPPRTVSMAFATASSRAPHSARSRPAGPGSRTAASTTSLARHVAVAALLGELVRDVEQACEVAADVHVPRGSGDRRDALDERPEPGPELGDVHLRPGKQRAHAAVALIEQRDEEMGGLDELVIAAHRKALRVGESELKPRRQLVR